VWYALQRRYWGDRIDSLSPTGFDPNSQVTTQSTSCVPAIKCEQAALHGRLAPKMVLTGGVNAGEQRANLLGS
jgi:hypothetical protein